jgi:type IV pilus assembly protein PilA
MGSTRQPGQSGFTLIELMIAVAIIGVLASTALGQFRDYTRRARMAEVILAATHCKHSITEGYVSRNSAPEPGSWGCESATASSRYVGPVQTSANGVIRLAIANLDPAVNGRHVYLVPATYDGTPMSTSGDLGSKIHQWLCGSDRPDVRAALPSSCRADTSPHAAANFE